MQHTAASSSYCRLHFSWRLSSGIPIASEVNCIVRAQWPGVVELAIALSKVNLLEFLHISSLYSESVVALGG